MVSNNVDVQIEYCGVCNYSRQCIELASRIKDHIPNAVVNCNKGRRGSFEVVMNEQLIHSKLSTFAFPKNEEIIAIAKDATNGLPIRTVEKQEPIETCSIM